MRVQITPPPIHVSEPIRWRFFGPKYDGVDFEPRQSMEYRSEIDVVELIKAANAELRDSSPEAYKVFLLAVGAGLRKKEIDLLEWSSFRWDENVIRIEATRYFHPKSDRRSAC